MSNRKYRITAIMVILSLLAVLIAANSTQVQTVVIEKMVKHRESQIRFVKPYDSQGKPVATERDTRRDSP